MALAKLILQVKQDKKGNYSVRPPQFRFTKKELEWALTDLARLKPTETNGYYTDGQIGMFWSDWKPQEDRNQIWLILMRIDPTLWETTARLLGGTDMNFLVTQAMYSPDITLRALIRAHKLIQKGKKTK